MISGILIFRLVLTVSLAVILMGCAHEKQLVRTDLQNMNAITITKKTSPQFLLDTPGSGSLAAAGVIVGGIPGAFMQAGRQEMVKANGKKAEVKYRLPDFGELLITRLNERAPAEVNGWPKTRMSGPQMSKDMDAIKRGVLVVSLQIIRLRADGVFEVRARGQLVDTQTNIVWQQSVDYFSSDYNRNVDMDKLDAAMGKPLHDEYAFAADRIVSTFIRDLRGETPAPINYQSHSSFGVVN
jgi:hypothetical protein